MNQVFNKISLLFFGVLFIMMYTSCEEDGASEDIIVQVSNELTVDNVNYDIKLLVVSTGDEVFDEYHDEGELVKFGKTSSNVVLNGSGAETIYSDTWTVHFNYKEVNDTVWFQGGLAPAIEIRGLTLKKGDRATIHLRSAELLSKENEDVNIREIKNRSYEIIVHDNKLWLIGGTDFGTNWDGDVTCRNEVFYSSDGENWSSASRNVNPWLGRQHHALASFNDKLWILGGTVQKDGYVPGVSINDIWYSENGITWNSATNNAPWQKRSGQECIVFNDKLLMFNGYPFFTDDNGFFNDIWSSIDGINWTLEESNAPWPLGWIEIVEYNNKLWCINDIARWDGIYANEVWNSDNGIDWNLVTDSIALDPISDPGFAVFNNKMWLIGGTTRAEDGINYRTNSTWFSNDGINWELANSECLPQPFSPDDTFIFNDKLWGIEYSTGYFQMYNTEDGISWNRVE